MSKLYFAFIFFVFISCTPSYNFVGVYECNEIVDKKIVLREDSTFTYYSNSYGVMSECSGRWEITGKNEVLIQCEDPRNTPIILTNGFILDFSEEVIVLDSASIEVSGQLFTRVDE